MFTLSKLQLMQAYCDFVVEMDSLSEVGKPVRLRRARGCVCVPGTCIVIRYRANDFTRHTHGFCMRTQRNPAYFRSFVSKDHLKLCVSNLAFCIVS